MDVHQRCSKLGKVWIRLPAAPWDKAGPFAKSNNTFGELKVGFKWARTVWPNLSSSLFAPECENCSGFLTFYFLCDNLERGQLGGEAVTPTAVFPLLYSHALLHHFHFFSPLSRFLHPVFYCLNFPLHLCVWKHFSQNSSVKFNPLTCGVQFHLCPFGSPSFFFSLHCLKYLLLVSQ